MGLYFCCIKKYLVEENNISDSISNSKQEISKRKTEYYKEA